MRITILLLLIVFASCKEEKTIDEVSIQGEAFGTSYAVKYFGNVQEAKEVQKGIDSVIYVINKSMSTYIPSSDISKINGGDRNVVIDDMFLDVFMLSRKLNKETSGYFDPTVGILRNAYGFGDEKPLNFINDKKLDSLMTYVGLSKVGLKKNRTISKKYPEVYLDFNAVAKGYGIDRVAVYMKSQGFENFLIDIGGEIFAAGIQEQKQSSWIVGIENLDSKVEARTASVLVKLTDKAMAGSGNYRKNRIDSLTGKQYVHTINPLTGSAEKSDVLSASVIASDCATADAWATSCMAMGLERSKKALEGKDVEAYLVYDGGVYMTKGFEKYLVD